MSVDINKMKKDFLRISYDRYALGSPSTVTYGLFRFNFQYLIIQYNDLNINPRVSKKGEVKYIYDTIENKWNYKKDHRILIIDGNLELIQKFSRDDYHKINKQQEDLFQGINESMDHTSLKKSFIQYILNEEGFTDIVEKFDRNGDNFALASLVDLSDNDDLTYNYFIKVYIRDPLEYKRFSYYDESTDEWVAYKDASDWGMEDMDLIGEWEQYDEIDEHNPVIFEFNSGDYIKMMDNKDKLFTNINEQVGSNFGEAKKEFIEFVLNKFKYINHDTDIDGIDREVVYELYKHEGLYVILILGSFMNEEYYQKNGYIYGKTGWKFFSDMEHLVDQRDHLELITRFSIGDYLDLIDKQNKLMNDINESVDDDLNRVTKSFKSFIYKRLERFDNDDNWTNVTQSYNLVYYPSSDHYVIHVVYGDKTNHKGFIFTDPSWRYVDLEINVSGDYEEILSMGFYEYKSIKNKQNKLFKDINEHKESSNESFMEWFSMKLQHKIGKRIGKGTEGVIHEYSKGKVIKIAKEDVIQQYKVLNKNIKGVAKIYHIGLIEVPDRFILGSKVNVGGEKKVNDFKDFKNSEHKIYMRDKHIGYIIMEEVDTSVERELDNVIDDLFEVLMSEDESGKMGFDKLPEVFRSIIRKYYSSDYQRIDIHDMLHIINLLSKENPTLFKSHLDEYYILDELIYELIDVLSSIGDHYEWDDIHTGQFGRNNKGELVAFDIGDDKITDLSKYPSPKNIIKEFKKYISNGK